MNMGACNSDFSSKVFSGTPCSCFQSSQYPFSLNGHLFFFRVNHLFSTFSFISSHHVMLAALFLFCSHTILPPISQALFQSQFRNEIHQMLVIRPLAEVFLVLSWSNETYPQQVSPEVFVCSRRTAWFFQSSYQTCYLFLLSPPRLETYLLGPP